MESEKKIISQGAEARIYESTFLGRDCIVKERFEKKYRHPTLDKKLNKQRITSECRMLAKCSSQGIVSPTIYFVDLENLRIYMEKIEGFSIKEKLYKENPPYESEDCDKLAQNMGILLSKLHLGNMIHGDLTTSNIMIRDGDVSKMVLIDMGLSFQSIDCEDKAVDLYVLERAFLSTHQSSKSLFQKILLSYQNFGGEESKKVINKLVEVRKRGRKKLLFG